MPSWKKVLISGSDAALNSLNVTTTLVASGITYPSSDGSSGQVLITDGAGQLSFSSLSSGGSGSSIKLSQTVAATTWSFAHNLNEKFPVVTIYDGSDEVIIPQKIDAVDNNNMLIYFSSARTGTAAAVVGGYTVSSSYSTFAENSATSSYALTASYLEGYISPFPFTGSAIITGSLEITGSISSTGGFTGSLQGTASNAISASFASNGGVTQLLAGPNVTLSPTNGRGQVTISAASSGGGGFNTATGSYGSFYDTTTQTNPVANIPRSMSLNTTAITNGVSVSGSISPFNTYIKTENAGVYNIQFSAQLDKTDSGTDEIVIWLRKNGINLTDTATTITLVGNNAKNVAAWNWFVNSAANDYYQIIWQAADTGIRLLAEPTDGHPGIPSVIVTANRVDQFLSNTGSFSGSFTGSLSGTATNAHSGSDFVVTNTLKIDGSLTDYNTVSSTTIGSNALYTQATGSYTAAFCKYTLLKGTNARAGEFMTVWNGNTTTYTDTSTTDIGSTSDISFISTIVTGNIEIAATAASTGWTIKTLVTYI
jgi:hypothetical protein